MHTVHLAETPLQDVKYAAFGIMFSVDKPTIKWEDMPEWQRQTIDDFFNSLKWEVTDSNPKVEEVPYGDLMMMVNTWSRYVYKGSVTTPPCDNFVYWNVMKTIYPIRAHHLAKFKDQLARDGLDKTGNNRVVQPYDEHDAHIIYDFYNKDNVTTESDPNEGLFTVLVIILGITLFLLQAFLVASCCKKAKK